jgi:hypothetical protein
MTTPLIDYDEYSIWDIKSILNYIKDHFIQILLLLLVIIIIYVVDHISNINAVLFGIPSAINVKVNKLENIKKNNAK